MAYSADPMKHPDRRNRIVELMRFIWEALQVSVYLSLLSLRIARTAFILACSIWLIPHTTASFLDM